MKALKEVQRILDMEEPWAEANKKLRGTTMRVNGNLCKVLEFTSKSSVIIEDPASGDSKEVTVNSLDVFLPESGIYKDSNERLILIMKQPKRQWLKSWHHSFYTCTFLPDKENSLNLRRVNVNKIIEESRVDIAVNNMKEIYYWDKKIGYFNKENNVVCTNALFEQELRDWVRSNQCQR